LLPSFYKNMTFKEKVQDLLNKGLQEQPGLFLVDLTINDANKITILLDGDFGVKLQDCIIISKWIDSNLDREEEDFSLEVASAGIGASLKYPRQYKKNIGRVLQIKTKEQVMEAKIIATFDHEIEVEWSSREPKKVGKGKETIIHNKRIAYSDILEAIVTITF